MSFTFTVLDKEHRNNILKVIDIIYDVVLNYFIHKTPKQLVQELMKEELIKEELMKEDAPELFNHNELIQLCVTILKSKQSQYQISKFDHAPEEVIRQLYNCIFGENGQHMNEFIYAKKGKGWCQRYFPPSNAEMYKFIVDKITHETKIQFYNPIKV